MIIDLAPELDTGAARARCALRACPSCETVIRMGGERTPGMMHFSELIDCAGSRSRAGGAAGAAARRCSSTTRSTSSSPRGTTGIPKGATLTHHNILNNGFFIGEAMKLTPRGPAVHSGAALPLLRHGARQPRLPDARRHHGLSRRGLRPARGAADAWPRSAAPALHGVPTMFIAELDHPDFDEFDLSSLRTGIMAGSPCPIEVMRRVHRATCTCREVTIAYGMTETCPVSFQSAHRRPARAARRDGRPHAAARRGQDRRRRRPHRAARRRRRAAARAATR